MRSFTQIVTAIGNKLLDLVRGFDGKNLNCEGYKDHPQTKKTAQFFKERAETRKVASIEEE